ncbi:hypothetical protein L596_003145 [Steinernema carpocapsae]|uniref:Uncharacterized protein n=1 Tax=Steinernema carpocapsae TaxID=34508 RepID=A0A4U8UUH8_STECR|nr:hypothetical protein L596_003145 [Steinernema carpocapsae]
MQLQQQPAVRLSPRSNPNGQAQLPQQQRMDQQDLQQELSHMQATPNAQCGCVLIVIQNQAQGTQSPQYQCQCTASPRSDQSNVHNNNFGNGVQYPASTYLPVEVATTTSVPTTTTLAPVNTNSNGANHKKQNPCQCIMISVRPEGPQSNYQCNCDQQNPAAESHTNGRPSSNGHYEPEHVFTTTEPNKLLSYDSSGKVQAYHTTYYSDDSFNGEFEAIRNDYVQETHAQPSYNRNSFSGDTETYGTSDDQIAGTVQHSNGEPPATTSCIVIRLPQNAKACVCQADYVQCAENTCCLSSRYRSMKGNPKTKDGGDSAVDLIMDVLKSIKTNLQKP